MAGRKTVCVQGLGFVGAANAIAIASVADIDGVPLYRVIGIERDNEPGRARAAALRGGRFPFAANDPALHAAARAAVAAGNLVTTTDASALAEADVIVIDVGLDLAGPGRRTALDLAPFRAAVATVGDHMRAHALVLLESTVPPGTSERIVAPLLSRRLAARGLSGAGLRLAYCYERVMPGEGYLASIREMARVYGGLDAAAADAAEAFLATIVASPRALRRLASIRAAELAKIVENGFRAVNIAFIDEWERFARHIDVDLFEVLEAIRVRPTHANIRYPGLGVGGYCLTKDPLFGAASAREIFGIEDVDFPLSTASVAINDAMPRAAVSALERLAEGDPAQWRIVVLGASYRPEVGDTRNSPALQLATALKERGARVSLVDPFAEALPDGAMPLHRTVPSAGECDILVLAVAHREFVDFDIAAWAGARRPLIFDANGVRSRPALEALKSAGFRVAAVGRGAI